LQAEDVTIHSLSKGINLTGFRNEKKKFQDYLCKEAIHDHEKNIGHVFLFMHRKDNKIVGYVTLAMSHIPKEGHMKLKGMTRYANVPALLLGQMARDLHYTRSGVGRIMIDWVISHAGDLSKGVGCRLIILNSVKDKIGWYTENGFTRVGSTGIFFLDLFE
jgi:hypothetical protein